MKVAAYHRCDIHEYFAGFAALQQKRWLCVMLRDGWISGSPPSPAKLKAFRVAHRYGRFDHCGRAEERSFASGWRPLEAFNNVFALCQRLSVVDLRRL
jgi:hypothetical protein